MFLCEIRGRVRGGEGMSKVTEFVPLLNLSVWPPTDRHSRSLACFEHTGRGVGETCLCSFPSPTGADLPGSTWPSSRSQAPELWCWSLWRSLCWREVHVLEVKPLALMALADHRRVEGQTAFPACPLPTSSDSFSSALALRACQVEACLRLCD